VVPPAGEIKPKSINGEIRENMRAMKTVLDSDARGSVARWASGRVRHSAHRPPLAFAPAFPFPLAGVFLSAEPGREPLLLLLVSLLSEAFLVACTFSASAWNSYVKVKASTSSAPSSTAKSGTVTVAPLGLSSTSSARAMMSSAVWISLSQISTRRRTGREPPGVRPSCSRSLVQEGLRLFGLYEVYAHSLLGLRG